MKKKLLRQRAEQERQEEIKAVVEEYRAEQPKKRGRKKND